MNDTERQRIKHNNDDLLCFHGELKQIFQIVMNSPNWNFMFELFHRFFYLYKGYKLDKNSYYHSLHTDLFLEFYMDKRVMYSPTWTYKDFLEWFKKWLDKYDDIKLSDEDNKELGRITHILRFECK